MKVQVFTIFDSASESFNKPFYDVSMGSALRAFADAINADTEGNMYYSHPEHFNLYHLGTFDDSSGAFECEGPPRMIQAGAAVSKKVVSPPVVPSQG